MIFTREELNSALRREVRILLHLAGKVDPAQLDYRPTPKQRSTLELLQYLAIMGPTQIAAIESGAFNVPALSALWGPRVEASKTMSVEQTVAAIAAQADEYPRLMSGWTDDDFRREVDMFGQHKATRGALLMNLVLGGHAAYRTQLFCYLKSCGREELNTMNLWAGVDGPA